MSRGARIEQRVVSIAYHQLRLLDVVKAVSAVSLPGVEIDFNLTLTDPAEKYLESDSAWRGCGGDYTVSIGERSSCRSGHDKGLPLVTADVGTFTRMWSGILSPLALAVSTRLAAPRDLLKRLDQAYNYPQPSPDWDH